MSHWKENSKVIWRLPGSLAPVGTIKSYGNFCFAEVYGAGHMVKLLPIIYKIIFFNLI